MAKPIAATTRTTQPGALPKLEQTTSADGERQIVLVKADQRYVFRCAPGDEGQLIAQWQDMARDPNTGLTSFDVAMLSHQLGQSMRHTLEKLQRRSTGQR